MREFASSSARAANLPRAAKLLYTAFCAFVGLGIASCAGLYDGIVVFAARATPAELYARLIEHYQTGMSARALLEVTHAHLFVVPMLLLVLGHLFLLTGLPAQTKLGWIGAAAGLSALHLLAPWAIRAWGGAIAWAYPITGAGMLVATAVLMGVPVYEMWAVPVPVPVPGRAGSAQQAGANRGSAPRL